MSAMFCCHYIWSTVCIPAAMKVTMCSLYNQKGLHMAQDRLCQVKQDWVRFILYTV